MAGASTGQRRHRQHRRQGLLSGIAVVVVLLIALALWVVNRSGDDRTAAPRDGADQPYEPAAIPPGVQVPAPPQAGLQGPFAEPNGLRTGAVLDVQNFGAIAGDNRDDGAAIRKALKEAKPGDVVQLPDGDLISTKPGIEVPTGVTVEGKSTADTKLRARFPADVSDNDSVVFFVRRGVTDVRIAQLTVEPAKGKLGHAVRILGGQRVTVEGLRVEQFTKSGISIDEGATHVLVRGNEISEAAARGGGGEGYGLLITGEAHDNWIVENRLGPKLRHALILQFRSHHNLVEHNESSDTLGDAFDFHGEGEYANELRFNRATGGGGAGIEIGKSGDPHGAAGPGNYVHDNEVFGHDIGISVGFRSNSQYVADNYVHDLADIGVLANLTEASDGAIDGLVVVRNRIERTAVGVQFRNVRALFAAGNTVRESGVAVVVDDSAVNVEIVGNDLRGNDEPSELSGVNGVADANRTGSLPPSESPSS